MIIVQIRRLKRHGAGLWHVFCIIVFGVMKNGLPGMWKKCVTDTPTIKKEPYPAFVLCEGG